MRCYFYDDNEVGERLKMITLQTIDTRSCFMKSLISFVLLSLVGLSALSKDLVVFNRSQLLDKIKGGWAGQVIGCAGLQGKEGEVL